MIFVASLKTLFAVKKLLSDIFGLRYAEALATWQHKGPSFLDASLCVFSVAFFGDFRGQGPALEQLIQR
jgi:hypothetical protein